MNKVMTIPNLLSMARIILAFVIWHISAVYGVDEKRTEIILLIVVSAITDVLDGKIARRFNMISEVGKVLDPVADKLTQGVLLICFMEKYETAKYVLVILIAKEISLLIMGIKSMAVTKANEGAQWFGKACTVLFHVIISLLLLIPTIPGAIAEFLIALCGIFMMISLILYGRYYKKIVAHG